MLKKALILLLGFVFVFVAWMNLTPGYFQYKLSDDCGCHDVVAYLPNNSLENQNFPRPICPAIYCQPSLFSRILITTANFDFNK